MKLTIRQRDCDIGLDRYVIERAEHDDRSWDERGTFGVVLCKSSRLCGIGGFSADIEGSAQEMRDIAWAIRHRREESAKRCSVDARQEPVLFGSPRNDNGENGHVSYADADDIATQIEALLG